MVTYTEDINPKTIIAEPTSHSDLKTYDNCTIRMTQVESPAAVIYCYSAEFGCHLHMIQNSYSEKYKAMI